MAMQARNGPEFTERKIYQLKNTIARECSDVEFETFLDTCKHLGLDPFRKQIYLIRRGNQMTIQTSIDGYRLIAQRSGKYMPGKEPTFTYDKDGRLVSATAYAKRMDSMGQWHEFGATVFLKELKPERGGGMWEKMPHVMLAKCAETAVLRKGFAAELGGIYTEEEMEQAGPGTIIEAPVTALEPQKSMISLSESEMLDEMIGSDLEYKKRILTAFGVDSFTKIPQESLTMIVERITLYNARKQELEPPAGEEQVDE